MYINIYMSQEIVKIFDFENKNYETLNYELYTLNKKWNEKTDLLENDIFGVDPESYDIDLTKSIYNPVKFCEKLDNCFNANIKLFENSIGEYKEINKDLLQKQLLELIPLYQDKYKENKNNYTNYITYNIANFAILNNLYRSENKNKYMCFGTGNEIEQIIPSYIISDITSNNAFYDIFIFENCDDDTFGCPDSKIIYEHLEKKLDKGKIKNIQFYHIKTHIEILSFWYILQKIYIDLTQIIMCDTIGSGHKLKQYLEEYNNNLNIIEKHTNNNFTRNFLIPLKIISYVSTKNKYIYFKENKFIGFQTDSFLLNSLTYDQVKNNLATEDVIKQKYLKYKKKYLALKATVLK